MAMGKQGSNSGGRYGRVSRAQSKAVKATWEDAAAEDLWRCIWKVTDAGDALTFAKTRDGGAVVITILSEDERVKQYATGPEEIATLIAEIEASVDADF